MKRAPTIEALLDPTRVGPRTGSTRRARRGGPGGLPLLGLLLAVGWWSPARAQSAEGEGAGQAPSVDEGPEEGSGSGGGGDAGSATWFSPWPAPQVSTTVADCIAWHDSDGGLDGLRVPEGQCLDIDCWPEEATLRAAETDAEAARRHRDDLGADLEALYGQRDDLIDRIDDLQGAATAAYLAVFALIRDAEVTAEGAGDRDLGEMFPGLGQPGITFGAAHESDPQLQAALDALDSAYESWLGARDALELLYPRLDDLRARWRDAQADAEEAERAVDAARQALEACRGEKYRRALCRLRNAVIDWCEGALADVPEVPGGGEGKEGQQACEHGQMRNGVVVVVAGPTRKVYGVDTFELTAYETHYGRYTTPETIDLMNAAIHEALQVGKSASHPIAQFLAWYQAAATAILDAIHRLAEHEVFQLALAATFTYDGQWVYSRTHKTQLLNVELCIEGRWHPWSIDLRHWIEASCQPLAPLSGELVYRVGYEDIMPLEELVAEAATRLPTRAHNDNPDNQDWLIGTCREFADP